MEFILIHRPMGTPPPEVSKVAIDFMKKVLANPEEVVPGGKIIASYTALNELLVICIWDVPNSEALTPFLEQLTFLMTTTQIFPAVKTEAFLEKFEKVLSLSP